MKSGDSVSARRRVLRGMLAGAAVLLSSPAIAQWLSKLSLPRQRVGERAIAPMARGSRVLATSPFTDGEQLVLVRMVNLMLPADGTAGAHDVATDTRVLFVLEQQGPDVIAGLKQAVAAVDGISQQVSGAGFAGASDAAAQQVMAIIASTPQMAQFWYTLRNIAVLDFYAQPAAYQPLGLPGPNIDAGGYPGGRPRANGPMCPAA